jgi:thymidylate kinase
MKRKLEAGTHLVVDRYAYSGVAFSTAKVRLWFALLITSVENTLAMPTELLTMSRISHHIRSNKKK